MENNNNVPYECHSGIKYAFDAFVVIKALVLFSISVQGIRWFMNKNYLSAAVILTLVISCFLVSFLLISDNIYSLFVIGHYRNDF